MEIVDLFFPKFCLECKKRGKYLCLDCLSKVKLQKLICPYCFKPSIDGLTHFKCRKTYCIDGLFSVWKHDGIIRKAIITLKYKYATEVGKELFEAFIKIVKIKKESLFGFPAIVPIPLYWYRENVRGFNQSIELSKFLSAELGWKINPEILQRKKLNKPQALLRGDERRKNLKETFVLSSDLTNIPSDVVLVDDVFTTGSTLKEAAKVLKKAGVKKVWGITISLS